MVYVGGQKVSNIYVHTWDMLQVFWWVSLKQTVLKLLSVIANLNENIESSWVSLAIQKFVNPEIPKVRTVRVR